MCGLILNSFFSLAYFLNRLIMEPEVVIACDRISRNISTEEFVELL